MTDTHDWKLYLPATPLAGSNYSWNTMLCPLIGCNTTNSNPKSLNLAKFSFSVCGWGGGVTQDQLKSKVSQSGQIFIFGGWVGGGVTLDQPKSEVPQSGQIFIFMGEGLVHPNFHWGGCTLDQLKSKVPDQLKSAVFQSGQIFILGQGTRYTNSNSKSQVLTQFSISAWEGGGGTLDTTFLKYLSGITQGILHQKFKKPNLPLHRR